MMIEQLMWCQPQDADDGQPKEGWTQPVDARQASTHPNKHYLSVKLKASPGFMHNLFIMLFYYT
jgi:hypothetical protein